MDSITQQNVALVEEATAAAAALHDQADGLTRVVGVFTLDDVPGQRAVRPAPAAQAGHGAVVVPMRARQAAGAGKSPAAAHKLAVANDDWETF
jgi:hypothetical protein